MKARRRTPLSLSAAGVSRRPLPDSRRPYARGICLGAWVRREHIYGWHTNLQDVPVIRHDKKIDLRVTLEARCRA